MPNAGDFTNVEQMNLGRWRLHEIKWLHLYKIQRLAYVISSVLVMLRSQSDRWTDGGTEGQTDGLTDRQTDGSKDRLTFIQTI